MAPTRIEYHGHWDDPSSQLPRQANEIITEETSSELLALFSRRRELMNQLAVLLAVASALLQVLYGKSLTFFSGVSLELLISAFFFLASLAFCLRFIQIHAGIIYNAIRFSVVEFRVFSKEDTDELLSDELAKTSRLHADSVSVLTIAFFATITGLSAVIFATFLGFNSIWLKSAIWCVAVILLLEWGKFTHQKVIKLRECLVDLYKNGQLPISGGQSELRTHYLSSLAETQADMICVTNVMALVTFASLSVFFSSATSAPTHPSAAVLFTGTGVLIGAMTIVMYSRLRKGVGKFCHKLQIPQVQFFERRVSDTQLGLIVLVVFLCLNCAAVVSSIGLHFPIHKAKFETGSVLIAAFTFVTVLIGAERGWFTTRRTGNEDNKRN